MKKILLLLTSSLVAVVAHAFTFSVGYYNYETLSTQGEVVCSGLSAAGTSANLTDLRIPGRVTYNGTEYRVQEIQSTAFRNNTTVKRVFVGWGIEHILDRAFWGCSQITQMHLPSTMKRIDEYAFYGCSSMNLMCSASSSAPKVDDNAFYNMKKCAVKVATYDGLIEHEKSDIWKAADTDGKFEQDGIWAFDYHDTDKDLYFVINTSRTTESYSAKGTLVGAGEDATYIPITSFTDDTQKTYGGCSSGYTFNLTVIESYSCQGNTKLHSIGRSDLGAYTGFQHVGDYAFDGCTGLTDVYIPGGGIWKGAFAHCTNLSTLQLYPTGSESRGVTSIGELCFDGCQSLRSFYIPQSLTNYDGGALANCPNLKTITISNNNSNFHVLSDNYGNSQLYNADYSTLLQVPGASSYTYLSPYCTTIGKYAYWGNTQIEDLDIPYGVVSIGAKAFGKSAIESIKIPSSISSGVDGIHQLTFDGLSSATKVVYINKSAPPAGSNPYLCDVPPGVVLCVPKGAVSNWSQWASQKFTGGVYEGAYDFCKEYVGNTGHYYTVISDQPYTDTNVQSAAAKGKARLVAGKHAWPGSGIVFTQNNSFSYQVANTIEGYIVTEIEADLFNGQSKLTSVSGGNGVKIIGARAFANCPSLGSCSLPNLTQIGDEAFLNCTGIYTYIAPESLLWVGQKAFYGCTALKELLFPRNGPNQSTGFNNDAFGNNASTFKCYVPLRHYDSFYSATGGWPNTGTTAREKLHPFVKPETQWTTITTCSRPLSLGSDATYYAITDFDATTRKLTTTKVTGNVAANTGLLMKVTSSNVGKYLRLTIATSGNTPSGNLLMPGTKNGVTLAPNNYYGDYLLNTTTNRFDRINASTTVYNDQAYLHIAGQEASRFAQYQIDQIYYRGFKYGDFWYDDGLDGDGSTDVTLIAPQRGDTYNKTTMEVPSSFTYNGRRRTVQAVDGGAFTGQLVNNLTLPTTVIIIRTDAFKDAPRLKQLVIGLVYNPNICIIEPNFASGNADGFTCYVFNRFINTFITSHPGINFAPWVQFDNGQYLPFSCQMDVKLPTNVKAYTVTAFDPRTRVATTKELTTRDIQSHTGLLLQGTQGQRLLLEKTSTTATVGTNYLRPYVQSSEAPSQFPNQATFCFDKYQKMWTSELNLGYGDSFLCIPSGVIGSDTTSPVYLDLEYTGLRGDLNGDGQVDVTDVSIAIDIVLGKDSNDNYGGLADLSGDGNVDVTDVSMLIDIVLGK